MYSESFKNLVEIANSSSELILIDKNQRTNPYYLGFGNPNSKILIVGQEKAIKSGDKKQIQAESLENPMQWNFLLENKIDNVDYKFYTDFHFKNPLHPYDGKPKNGNTWLKYQKLMNLVYPDFICKRNNNFLLNSFITEINHQVSLRQLGNQNDENREKINSHNFYKNFPVTILAIGKYLKNNEIENRFNVSFQEDYSQPREKLIFFMNESKDRVVLNTRQLSNDISNEYLKRIAEIVKNYAF